MSEQRVRSADGTAIGFLTLGSGPPLVFVHGSLTTGDDWRPVAAALADRFTCCIMSRRGRGRSGDGPDYSLDKECQDIQAVLDACGTRPHLLGHSYGAVCALETARRSPIGKLILCEPPLPVDGTVIGPAFPAFRDAVQRRQLDEALTIMLKDLGQLSAEQVARLRGRPLWNDLAALTPSALRELETIDSLEPGVDRFAGVMAPALLLVGTGTARHHKVAARALQARLPNARTVLFEGQGHDAHVSIPDVVAREIAGFLGSN
jgi:pimeloyl-ACP methyl ester carboxylesterase